MSEAAWKEYSALLDREHRALRETVAAFPPERLEDFPREAKFRFITQIYGIALHDVYHAGQIQLLKRLRTQARNDRPMSATQPLSRARHLFAQLASSRSRSGRIVAIAASFPPAFP